MFTILMVSARVHVSKCAQKQNTVSWFKATYLLRPGVRNLRWQLGHGYTRLVSASIDFEDNIVAFDADKLLAGEVRDVVCEDEVVLLLFAIVRDLGDDRTVILVSESPGVRSDDMAAAKLIISTVPCRSRHGLLLS